MAIAEQILCWAVGLALLALTFRLVHKDRWGFAGATFLATVLFFLCGMSWVQGLMKTGVISAVTGTLKGYGQRLEQFQSTAANMRTELSDQQAQINGQQKELSEHQIKMRQAQLDMAAQQANITNQYLKLSGMEEDLASAQTNIFAQAQKLQDVEDVVQNIYAKMLSERIDGNDSNRIAILTFSDNARQVFFKLGHAPIHNTVRGIMQRGGLQQPLFLMDNFKNIAYGYFSPGPEPKDAAFTLEYLIDTRETNLYSTIVVKEGKVFVDDTRIYFERNGDAPPFTADQKK